MSLFNLSDLLSGGTKAIRTELSGSNVPVITETEIAATVSITAGATSLIKDTKTDISDCKSIALRVRRIDTGNGEGGQGIKLYYSPFSDPLGGISALYIQIALINDTTTMFNFRSATKMEDVVNKECMFYLKNEGAVDHTYEVILIKKGAF